MTRLDSPKPHVVVVGAGILGASVAFHLTLRGAHVTIVDSSRPGQGTTKVSFAWLNAYGKTPFHYYDLNRRSMEMWSRLVRRLERPIDIVWGGELRWAVTPEGAADLDARARQLQAWGYPTRILDADEVKGLEPDLHTEGMTAASYSDLEGHVNTGHVVETCIAAAQERGAELVANSPVTGLRLGPAEGAKRRVEAVQSGDTRIPCDVVVLAGGADMPALAGLAEVALPLYHTFGATIVTEPVPPLFRSVAVLHTPREREPLVNVLQFSDGSVVVQSRAADNHRGGDRGETDAEVDEIMADAEAVLPALQGVKVKEVRRGRRPIPRDGEPIVGFADEVPNLYVATSHSGVTLAPIIGEFAAIEIVVGVEVELLQPFRLKRFTNR